MIRRIVSVLTLALFLFGLASPAMAQGESAKISQEEALKIARAAFDIPDSQKNVQISYREEDYNNKKIWDFSWDFSRFNKYSHISVGIDADTGDVLNYFENQEPLRNKKPGKLKTEEECKKIAAALMQKIAPGKFSQTKEKSNPYPKGYAIYNGQNTYSFLFERQVNGIAFPENTMNVTVNAENGKVVNYYCNWDNNLTFPALDQTIKSEEAEKIFREKIGLQLTYISPYGWSPVQVANKKTVGLYYSVGSYSPYGFMAIDANTGTVLDGTGQEAKVSQKVYRPVLDEPVISMPEKTLTLEEAKAKVRDFVVIPSEYKLQSTRYSEGWGGSNQKVWDFQYSPNPYGGEKQLNVTVNAATGEVLGYNVWDFSRGEPEDKPVNYDINKCQKIAKDYLKRAVPGKADYVSLLETSAPQVYYYNGKAKTPPTYNFTFVRNVRGIPFPMNSINIEVNNNTGEIMSFRQSWDVDSKFTENKDTISPEEAMNKLLAVEKPRLVYTRKQSEDGRQSSVVMPVYQLYTDFPKIVDAKTGKVTSDIELQNPVKLDDISGHWAEAEIRRLAAWGIVSGANDKFYPDKQITRAEFVTMLVAAKGIENDPKSAQAFTDVSESSWCYNAVQAASQAGLVKGSGGKFEPNQIITKQEITVLLMKALNGEQEPEVSAGLPEKFKDENTIAPWARKSVTQALELGIIRGQNGYLKITVPATRAEAVVMLARTLENSSNTFGPGYGIGYAYGATRVYG